MEEINLRDWDGQIVVGSKEVAERFGKRHDKLTSEITRMYSELIGSPQNGGHPYFIKTTYIHEQNGQEYVEYLMNRDGFSLLVMGFTGKKALEWKLKYIEAFNRMENTIKTVLTDEDMALLAISKANTPEEKALAVQKYREIVTLPLENAIKEQKPLVSLAEKRIDMKGCYSITDTTQSLNLKRGQITKWAKDNGYIHKKLQEVNSAGMKWFKVYSSDMIHNQIGITEEGLKYINENLETIRTY